MINNVSKTWTGGFSEIQGMPTLTLVDMSLLRNASGYPSSQYRKALLFIDPFNDLWRRETGGTTGLGDNQRVCFKVYTLRRHYQALSGAKPHVVVRLSEFIQQCVWVDFLTVWLHSIESVKVVPNTSQRQKWAVGDEFTNNSHTAHSMK